MSLVNLSLLIQKPFVKEKSTERVNEFLTIHKLLVRSKRLKRKVRVDLYLPADFDGLRTYKSLLLNDGQDMKQLRLSETLTKRYELPENRDVVVVAVHAGDRLNEYGTAGIPDYAGRGWKAKTYANFIVYKLLPYLRKHYGFFSDHQTSVAAGFSLGGLSAMDMAWRHPEAFMKTGVFSGSFWWRSSQPDERYPDADRIMHYLVGAGSFKPGMKFWFQAGTKDEECDRNNNGVIDAIDDTLDLISVLKAKGYTSKDVAYLEVEDGEHNYDTWSEVFPEFLAWAFPMSARVRKKSRISEVVKMVES